MQDCSNSSANALDLLQSCINSLAPGGFENIIQNVFFKLISWIDTLSNSCETALRSMPQNPSDDKSTLVQVMAWCRQAASHYLSQCCPRSLSPYGVTRPQWVKPSLNQLMMVICKEMPLRACSWKRRSEYTTWWEKPYCLLFYGVNLVINQHWYWYPISYWSPLVPVPCVI